ncbi:MAG: CheR family methyltransferase [Pirellula sp.]|jgi:chemotaxis protein methyltransferase CheR
MSTIAAALDPQSFNFITNLVRSKSAIVLESGKAYLVESRLSPVARELGLKNIAELVSELQKPGSQKLTQRVVEAMTTNETSFFRDIHPFTALKEKIIPNLIQRRAKEKSLSIWSNACSSGQEPYTIAMLIAEHFPILKDWKIRIISSDLSSQILDRARLGEFNQTEVNRGLPMNFLLKYFTKNEGNWKIRDEIRKMVEFRELNLVEPFPALLPAMDIVFLRNVLIYFSPETKSEILKKVHKVMHKDSYLFLGGSETTMNLNVRFEREQLGSAVCYRPT